MDTLIIVSATTTKKRRATSQLRVLAGLIVLCFASASTESTVSAMTPPPSPIFEEVSSKVGLDFRHFNGMTGKLLLPEVMGSGAALFDFDNDGDLDVFLVQGSVLESGAQDSRSTVPWVGPGEPRGRLFRNDLNVKSGQHTFQLVDVTEASGIRANHPEAVRVQTTPPHFGQRGISTPSASSSSRMSSTRSQFSAARGESR